MCIIGSAELVSLAPPAPIDLNASSAFASLRHAESGGNSTMRRIVPFSGGSRRTGLAAASLLPSLLAGDARVSQRSVSASPGIDAISLTLGARPSLTIIDLPPLSCPVTTLRTLQTIVPPRGSVVNVSRPSGKLQLVLVPTPSRRPPIGRPCSAGLTGWRSAARSRFSPLSTSRRQRQRRLPARR